MKDAVDGAWAAGLGCDVALLRSPGAHLVPGGPEFSGYNAVYLARFDRTVLVYCPDDLRQIAADVLRSTPPDDVFTVGTVERIAEGRLEVVRGPGWHGFVDDEHFVSMPDPVGERLSVADRRLADLARACGAEEWAEAGFVFDEGEVYGVEVEGHLVAAGNMNPFRGRPADVGLLTHPDHRGQGWAKRLASRMIADALPHVGVVRYRSRTTNAASLAVAQALGFVGRGENLVGRLRPPSRTVA